MEIRWKDEPDEHDYPAAEAFLSLTYSPKRTAQLVAALRESPITSHKAKDILRASGLPSLTGDNKHVAKNIAKIRAEKLLSPILLVREETHRKLIIADGWHRTCAVELINEDAEIPCKLV